MVPASYRNSIYTKFSKLFAQALRIEKTILCFLRPFFTRSKWNIGEILAFLILAEKWWWKVAYLDFFFFFEIPKYVKTFSI